MKRWNQLFTVAILTLATYPAQSAEFVPLGFRTYEFISASNTISIVEDGSVVVGLDYSEDPPPVVKWTPALGLQTMVSGETFIAVSISGDASKTVATRVNRSPIFIDGDLVRNLAVPADPFGINPRDIKLSQDGSTILASSGAPGSNVYRWTTDELTLLPTVVATFGDVAGISNDGKTFVGRSYRWSDEDGKQALPSLPGMVVRAFGLSSDGRWAVGRLDTEAHQPTANIGTRWDGLSLPEPLLPADESWGTAGFDVSADGGLVVGRLYLSDEPLERRAEIAAGIWTEDVGQMVPLQDLLVSDYGLGVNLEGYHLTGVYDVTDDGRFMVGHMINPDGLDEAFLVDLGPPLLLPGDYNNNGTVEQADLDLVLLHWGTAATAVPDTWTNDLPTGTIDQAELDGVLLNWGTTSSAAVANAAVPEPGTCALLIVVATIAGAVVRSAKGPVILA